MSRRGLRSMGADGDTPSSSGDSPAVGRYSLAGSSGYGVRSTKRARKFAANMQRLRAAREAREAQEAPVRATPQARSKQILPAHASQLTRALAGAYSTGRYTTRRATSSTYGAQATTSTIIRRSGRSRRRGLDSSSSGSDGAFGGGYHYGESAASTSTAGVGVQRREPRYLDGVRSGPDSADYDQGYAESQYGEGLNFQAGRMRLPKRVMREGADLKNLKKLRGGDYIEAQYDGSSSSKRNDYYSAMRSAIRKEIRRVIVEGVQRVQDCQNDGAPSTSAGASNQPTRKKRLKNHAIFTVKPNRDNDSKMSYKAPRNEDNPCSFTLTGRLPDEPDCGTSSLLYYFTFPFDKNKAYLGIVNQRGNGDIHLSVILDEDEREALERGLAWAASNPGENQYCLHGHVLGSIITEIRMYDVCCRKPSTDLIKSLMSAELPAWNAGDERIDFDACTVTPEQTPVQRNAIARAQVIARRAAARRPKLGQSVSSSASMMPVPSGPEPIDLSDELGGLNEVQRRVALQFIAAPSGGAYLLQGPPGTGKTTTVSATIRALLKSDPEMRLMVCAGSNKAVQELALRLLPDVLPNGDDPGITIAMAGVEQKLDDRLRGVFIHTFADKLREYKRTLEKLAKKMDVALLKRQKTPEKIRVRFDDLFNQFETQLDAVLGYIRYALGESSVQFVAFHDLQRYLGKLLRVFDTIEAQEWTATDEGEVGTSDAATTSTRSRYVRHSTLSGMDRYKSQRTSVEAMVVGLAQTISGRGHKAAEKLEIALLNHARVVFMTTSVAGRGVVSKINDNFGALIIDEAAQDIEMGSMIPISRMGVRAKVLIVGDPMQLPPTVLSQRARELGYERPLMTRLLEASDDTPMERLNVQYRMHPQIRAFPSRQFYDHALQDGENIATRLCPFPELYEQFEAYTFLDVKGKESKRGKSTQNAKEADAVVNLVRHLRDELGIDVSARVGVISFYAAQCQLLSNKLNAFNVPVKTVDGFQGGECDIIIISFVRTNRNSIGFLKDFRRLNVAITRARFGLFVVGNADALAATESDVQALVLDARERDLIVDYDSLPIKKQKMQKHSENNKQGSNTGRKSKPKRKNKNKGAKRNATRKMKPQPKSNTKKRNGEKKGKAHAKVSANTNSNVVTRPRRKNKSAKRNATAKMNQQPKKNNRKNKGKKRGRGHAQTATTSTTVTKSTGGIDSPTVGQPKPGRRGRRGRGAKPSTAGMFAQQGGSGAAGPKSAAAANAKTPAAKRGGPRR